MWLGLMESTLVDSYPKGDFYAGVDLTRFKGKLSFLLNAQLYTLASLASKYKGRNKGISDDERTKGEYYTEHTCMQLLLRDGTERKESKQELAFYTGGNSDRVCDNEYDRHMQMKYRNNNDNQHESEV